MALKLGTTDISAVYLGTTAVTKVYLGTTEVWSAGGVATPQLISTANANTSSIASMPTHATGDLLLMFAERESNSGPTVPGGWTTIASQIGSNNMSVVLAYKIAASGSETSGTWSSAEGLILEVWRNAKIGASVTQTGSSATVVYPALTLRNPNGTSWVAAYGAHRNTNGSMGVAPSGMTNAVNVNGSSQDFASHNTNGQVSSWTSQNAATGETASGYGSIVVELAPSSVIFPVLFKSATQVPTSFSYTIPPHEVGDLILLWVDDTSMPVVPAAGGTVPTWTTITTIATYGGRAVRLVYAVATANNHTTGNWGAPTWMGIVLTGQAASSFIGGTATATASENDQATAPAITLSQSDGTSAILHLVERDYGFAAYGTTSGYTTRIAGNTGLNVATKNTTTSDGSVVITHGGTAANVRAISVEIKAH